MAFRSDELRFVPHPVIEGAVHAVVRRPNFEISVISQMRLGGTLVPGRYEVMAFTPDGATEKSERLARYADLQTVIEVIRLEIDARAKSREIRI